MVKRQLVCNVFHNIKSDDFYIGTASAIYCATGFPLPLNRSQMGALLGISEDTMIEKVVYNDFDCAYKSDLEGFNLDDNVKNEVEVKKMAVGIYYMGETLIPLATEDKKMAGLICWSQLAPVEDEIKNNGFIRFYQRKLGNGRTYFVVKNGMRVRAAVTSYSLNEYAEATLQELVAMLAETHTGEQEEHEQTFDNLTQVPPVRKRVCGVLHRRRERKPAVCNGHNVSGCQPEKTGRGNGTDALRMSFLRWWKLWRC